MKKAVALLLCLVFIMSFSGCGSNTEPGQVEPPYSEASAWPNITISSGNEPFTELVFGGWEKRLTKTDSCYCSFFIGKLPLETDVILPEFFTDDNGKQLKVFNATIISKITEEGLSRTVGKIVWPGETVKTTNEDVILLDDEQDGKSLCYIYFDTQIDSVSNSDVGPDI